MEQFNLEKWLQNKSRKICTRDGRPVRIVCWDSPNKTFPIVGFVDGKEEIFVWDCFGYCREGHIESDFDLFFANEKKTNKILDELKSYLKNTPKEQVEKDWKEIQDWYVQHFTNEKHDGEEELTEFERTLSEIIDFWQRDNGSVLKTQSKLKSDAKTLIDLARKELEKENSNFKPKFTFTYNEKDYSKLGNKLIEFRNNTPLFSVSYRDGEGRKVILHYEKEILDLVRKEVEKEITKEVEQKAINHTYAYQNGYENGKYDALKDLPKWKKATEYKDFEINEACILDDDIYPIIATNVNIGEYYLELDELKNLPLEE